MNNKPSPLRVYDHTARKICICIFFCCLSLSGFGQRIELVDPTPAAACMIAGCTPYTPDGDPANPTACGTVTLDAVEVGLIRKALVTFRNIGAPGLDVTARITSGSPEWSITDNDGTADGILNILGVDQADGIQTIELVFRPGFPATVPANIPGILRIQSNSDPCYIDADGVEGNGIDINIDLNCTAKKTPLGVAMVLDRSGSMSQAVGATTRIELLKTASKFFVDLLATRNNSSDQLAAVRYSSSPNVIISRGPVDAAAAKATFDTQLSASGSTATGSALELGNTEIDAAPANGKNITILFTDGEENVGPTWMSGANTANSSQVYTIGMGSLVGSTFQVNLSNYAAMKGGSYYYVPETTLYNPSTLPTDLLKAYLDIFTDATDLEAIVDPVYQVHLTGIEKLVASTWITSSDHRALFTVFDDPALRQAYDLEIRSPKGAVIANGPFGVNLVGGISTGNGYTIFTVDFSSSNDESDFVGQWNLYLKPKNQNPDLKNKIVNIGFAASAFSDLKLNLGVGATNYVPGSLLNVGLDFMDAGLAIKEIQHLQVQLTSPSGQKISLNPVKDNFGKWFVSYPHTYTAGTYQLFVRATLLNSKGQQTTREQTNYYAFGHPLVPDQNCIPCIWIKVIIGLALLLLLLILFRVWILRRSINTRST
jgi:hypothetical protein